MSTFSFLEPPFHRFAVDIENRFACFTVYGCRYVNPLVRDKAGLVSEGVVVEDEAQRVGGIGVEKIGGRFARRGLVDDADTRARQVTGPNPRLQRQAVQAVQFRIMIHPQVSSTFKMDGLAQRCLVTEHESEFIIGLYGPTTRPGTYDLYISVGQWDGTPTIALPLTGDEGQRRYKIGTITLE